MNAFMDALLSQNVCPEEMKVRDERTYTFLKAFCERMKITVSIESDLPALDSAEEILIDHFDKTEEEQIEDMTHMLDALLSLDVIQNQKLPEEMAVQLGMLADMGILPEHLEKKINELLCSNVSRKPGKKKSRNNQLNEKEEKAASMESYVFSVSAMPGCYRHIQISSNSTLQDLHSAILDAFDFEDDHAHAFFMDNKLWSRWDSYFMEGTGGEDEISTKERKLYQLELCKGSQFKYLFDFGDEWVFQCKVLRLLEEETEFPRIVRSKGKSPDQYGLWEDDDWEDE